MLVTFASEKGGAGKTTLAGLLAERWTAQGLALELYDADPQASLVAFAAAAGGRLPEARAVHPPQIEDLADAPGLALLDLPSGLGESFYVALAVSDAVVIPAAPSVIDLRTLRRTLAAVRRAQELRPELDAVLVLAKINRRERASRDLMALAHELGWPVARASLGDRSAYRRAGAGGLGALPRSSRRQAALEVAELGDELRGRFGLDQDNEHQRGAA